jgi:hypothetical protein
MKRKNKGGKKKKETGGSDEVTIEDEGSGNKAIGEPLSMGESTISNSGANIRVGGKIARKTNGRRNTRRQKVTQSEQQLFAIDHLTFESRSKSPQK